MSQKVIITGASGGFGKLTTLTLLEKGYKVAATMRDPEGKNKEKAEQLRAAGAFVTALDVTDDTSVAKGIKTSIEAMGGLDVVINNAGVGVFGMQEHFTTDDFQKLFEVNVFGVQRVNREAIPTLRQQGSGLLITVSSLLGRMVMPFYGPYNASKWAVEALAENYRVELSGFGVDSVIVEPGGFETTFFEGLIIPSDQSRNESYGEFMNAPMQMAEGFGAALKANTEQDPQLVADAILQLIETPAGKRPVRTTVDKMGMAAAIDPMNSQLDQVTEAIYNNFGIGGMLKVKTND